MWFQHNASCEQNGQSTLMANLDYVLTPTFNKDQLFYTRPVDVSAIKTMNDVNTKLDER